MEPSDPVLYARAKRYVYAKYPQQSAYRSGRLVQRYRALGGTYKGGPGRRARAPLARWFRENWKSDTGRYGYTSRSSVYRPTKRVSKATPKTFSELTPRELARAKRTKREKGRARFS